MTLCNIGVDCIYGNMYYTVDAGLRDFTVAVGATSTYADMTVCLHKCGAYGTGRYDIMFCQPDPIQGQFLAVYRYADVTEYFSVCEIKIFVNSISIGESN